MAEARRRQECLAAGGRTSTAVRGTTTPGAPSVGDVRNDIAKSDAVCLIGSTPSAPVFLVSDIDRLGDVERVVDLAAELADGARDLGVAELALHPAASCRSRGRSASLGRAPRIRAEQRRIEARSIAWPSGATSMTFRASRSQPRRLRSMARSNRACRGLATKPQAGCDRPTWRVGAAGFTMRASRHRQQKMVATNPNDGTVCAASCGA